MMKSVRCCQTLGIVYPAACGVLLIARFMRLDLQMTRWAAEMCKNRKMLKNIQSEDDFYTFVDEITF